jgi:AraC-like DNA-binding protein
MRTLHRSVAFEAEPEAGAPVSRTMRATLRERAKIYIGRHIRDVDLSVEKIAAALNCSKRYLHLVFNAGEETVSEYVWRQRLEGCRAELSNPAFRLTLTEIAYAWGFNSSAHFSRAFKERYGVPPSAQRLAPLTPDPSRRRQSRRQA